MKFLNAIAIIVLLTLSFTAHSQQDEKIQKTPEERAKRELKAIQKECNLSNEQSVKVEQILVTTQNKLAIVKASKPAQRGDRLKEMKTIGEEQNTEMAKILSPEQYTKYQALIEKQKEKIRNRMMERQAGGMAE